ncbi:MAG: quinone-dependent dihydroorotate dehydrogenase [Pseudomonadota bacterium]
MSGPGESLSRGLEGIGLALLRRLDPETAHGLALRGLRAGFGPSGGPVTGPRLTTDLAGIALANPVGIAAGFDKNAEAVDALSMAGPGFVELGAVTPRPQPGNPRPRLFRLSRAEAVINRFGFNNAGMAAMADRLSAHRAQRPAGAAPVGLNLGANKDSADRAGDYITLIRGLGERADFVTINVSSPNTERLRDLQGAAALSALMMDAAMARDETADAHGGRLPLFLKIAPDLDDDEIDDIAEAALNHGIDAIIATNTTLSREGIAGRHAGEAGGLSGPPLFARSTRVLARLWLASEGRIPLIGVGGIGSAADAYAKIRAGASAVQLYTALAYCGLWLVHDIARGLDAALARDGYASVAEAVGVEAATLASNRG